MNALATIRQLLPGVERARDERLAKLAEVEAEPPVVVPDPECAACKAAREAYAAARAAADAQSRRREVLRGEILLARPKMLREFERWLETKFDEHRARRPQVRTERRATSGAIIRAWNDAGWCQRTAEVLIEARREVRDELPFVNSRALPERIAAIRARVQAQLDTPEDERFVEMSKRALELTGSW